MRIKSGASRTFGNIYSLITFLDVIIVEVPPAQAGSNDVPEKQDAMQGGSQEA